MVSEYRAYVYRAIGVSELYRAPIGYYYRIIEPGLSNREAIFKAIFLTALLRPEAIFSHFQTAFLPAAERPKRF